MSVLAWIQKGKRAFEWMERLWEEPRDPLDDDATVLLSEEQLGYIEERAADASVSARHDLRMLVMAVRRQNEKMRRATAMLGSALRSESNGLSLEEQVADALHVLRHIAPSTPAQNDAVARLVRAMQEPLAAMFSEGELVDVFMAPTNPLEGVTVEPTLMQAFAALFTMNFGSDDTSEHIGEHEVGGPYGRYGLTQEESRVLASLQGFVGGWLRAFGADPKTFYETVGEEVKRVGLLRASWSERLSAGEELGSVLPASAGVTLVSVPPMRLTMDAADARAIERHPGITLGETKGGATEVYMAMEPVAVVRGPVRVEGALFVGDKKLADVTSLEIDGITKIDK